MGNRKNRKAEQNGAAPSANDGEFSLISNQKLLALYAGLLTCREERANHNAQSASICGHEAALVGATIDLGLGDAVCFPDHGVVTGFSEGMGVRAFLLEAGNHLPGSPSNGRLSSGADRNGGSAAGLAYTHAAIGTALAHKTKTNRKVAVVFSNEESSETLREALHIATVHALPMVFVHQPDRHGDKAPGKRSRKGPSKLKTPWFPSITVDCHDVVALYRVAFEAISRARLGRGPTLIECRPYRLNSARANRNGAHAEDPILHMQHYLRAKGLLDSKLAID